MIRFIATDFHWLEMWAGFCALGIAFMVSAGRQKERYIKTLEYHNAYRKLGVREPLAATEFNLTTVQGEFTLGR